MTKYSPSPGSTRPATPPKHRVAEAITTYRAVPQSDVPAASVDAGPARVVRLFRNGANQAVRIPKDWELPGPGAVMHREGNRIVIEPAQPTFKKGSPAAIIAMLDALAQLGPIDEEFSDVDEGMLPLDDIDLGDPPHDEPEKNA